jgi:hypothetical protein
VEVEELRFTSHDLATGKMLTDLGQVIRRSLAVAADESSRSATSFSTTAKKED